MRTKRESPLRAAGRRRPAKQIARVSGRIRSTESDATVAAIADGMQADDMGEVVLYKVKDRIRLEVRIQRGTVWLTQAQMAKLFGRERSVVSKHVNNLFAEGELDRNSNVQNLHIASSERELTESVYNLCAEVLRELLQHCASVKTVRLCLQLGRELSLPWATKLDPATLPTGSRRPWVSKSADGLLVLKP